MLALEEVVWAIGSCCAIHRKPFDAQLLASQHAPPYSLATVLTAARVSGFQSRLVGMTSAALAGLKTTALVTLKQFEGAPSLGLVVSSADGSLTWIPACGTEPITETIAKFDSCYGGRVILLQPIVEPVADEGAVTKTTFGFRWFVPELLKQRVWAWRAPRER